MSRKKKTVQSGVNEVVTADMVKKLQQLKTIEPELLGKRLRMVRSDKKISQRDLTRGLFTSAYLSSVELGKTRPTMETLVSLADRLGEPVDYFLNSTSGSSKVLYREFDREQFHWLELRHHLYQADIALVQGATNRAELELNQVLPDVPGLYPSERIYFHLLQGILKNRQNRWDEALVELGQLKDLQETDPALQVPPEMKARYELESGRAYQGLGQNLKALEHFLNGLAEKMNNQTNIWHKELLLEACEASQGIGEFEQAASLLSQGQALFGSQTDYAMVDSLLDQAEQPFRLGDFQEAAFLLGQSRALALKAGEINLRLDFALKASNLNYQLERYQEARQAALLAEGLARLSNGQPEGKALDVQFSSLVMLAKTYFQDSEFSQVQFYLNQAGALLQEHQDIDPIEKARYYQVAAQNYSNSNQFENATESYKQAISLLEAIYNEEPEKLDQVRPVLAEIYYNFSQLLKQAGNLEETMENLEKAYRLRAI